jgi:TctA family transporter
MSLTEILILIVIALFVVIAKFVIDGVREKNWKKSIISILIFGAIILLLYFGLIRFITSM